MWATAWATARRSTRSSPRGAAPTARRRSWWPTRSPSSGSPAEADLRARFGSAGAAARSDNVVVLGGDEAADQQESDDEATPRFPLAEAAAVSAPQALEPRRLAQRAWRLEAVVAGARRRACGWLL